MRSIAFAATIAALPALAGNTVSIDNVNPQNAPLIVQLVPSDDYAGEVIFNNQMTYRTTTPEGPYILEIDGLRVIVDLDQQPGDLPDRMIVTPPDGYIARPPEIVVQEGEVGSIIIQRFVGM